MLEVCTFEALLLRLSFPRASWLAIVCWNIRFTSSTWQKFARLKLFVSCYAVSIFIVPQYTTFYYSESSSESSLATDNLLRTQIIVPYPTGTVRIILNLREHTTSQSINQWSLHHTTVLNTGERRCRMEIHSAARATRAKEWGWIQLERRHTHRVSLSSNDTLDWTGLTCTNTLR